MPDPSAHLPAVLDRIDADLDASLERLFALLRIPSISTDPAYAAASRECAEHLRGELAGLGFAASVRDTAGHPVVMGRSEGTGPGPHLLFYGHYDVQPVDPLELWDTPPFEPRIAEIEPGRKAIVARGACDDKGQVMTFLEACRAWRAVAGSLPVSLTLLIEGEEESGSINLPAFIRDNADELRADLALVCDTGMWDRGTPAITSSLRGLCYDEVTITAADRDLHSGMFGGAAQNPIHVLSRIIGALHDDAGRVAIPGFYEGVHEISPETRAAWDALGLTAEGFLGTVGLKHSAGERDRSILEQIQSRPTCDVNGVWGGYAGEGTKTVIPSQASAKVSFRLVGDQDPDAVSAAFRAFVEARLPPDVTASFRHHKGSRAIALPADMPSLVKARAALRAEWGVEPAVIGSGGSIPVVGDFKRSLGMDTLLVGFGLDDDRVHSPNEKYDLSSFRGGIRSWARILAALS